MPHHVHTRVSPPNNTPFYIIQSVSCHHYITLPLSTWLNLSRAMSLLGLCALLWMIKPCASPSSRENSMVVMPFASLLSKSGILFLLLSQPFPPCLQNLPLQTVFWPVIAFSAAQNWNSASLFLFVTALAFKLVYTPPPPPPTHTHILSHMCVHVNRWACALYWHCVHVILCVCVVCVWVHTRTFMCAWFFVCVFAMLCMKMFVNFHMFCTLVYHWSV